MIDGASVDVDISNVIRGFHTVKINVHKAMPKLLARLSLKGEDFMKHIAPHRTGTLRRSIHAHPKIRPVKIGSYMEGMETRPYGNDPGGVPIGVNYAWAANKYSKSPQYIERTSEHIKSIIPKEADIIIKNALRGMDK